MPGRVAFFRTVEVEAFASGAVTLQLFTDLPGDAMALRETKTLIATAGSPRRVYKFHLSGNTKGRIYRVELTTAGIVRLFAVRIFARAIGGDWTWLQMGVEPSPEAWSLHPLPIAGTASEFTEHPLPIAGTASEFTEHPLPIEGTASEFHAVALPIPPTSDIYTWIKAGGPL